MEKKTTTHKNKNTSMSMMEIEECGGGGGGGGPLKRRCVLTSTFSAAAAEAATAARALFTDTTKYEEFVELQRTCLYNINELVYTLPHEVFEERAATVEARGLSDAAIVRALAERKLAVETAHESSAAKVQESMLQLFRVLCRRKIAVLQGQQLPDSDSLFARNR